MRKKILLTKQKNHEKDISILVLFMGFLFLMSTNVEAGDTLVFQPIYQGPGDGGGEGGEIHPRSPITSPTIVIDGHTLYFINGCDDTGLAIVDLSEDEVYNTTIPTGMTMLVLPEWLQGTFELQIRCGQYIFVAEIEL